MGQLVKDSIDVEILRLIESALAIVIITKLLYFMRLIDSISPLVNIILLIFRAIGWFMLILIIFLLGFSTSFYLIGQNLLWYYEKTIK